MTRDIEADLAEVRRRLGVWYEQGAAERWLEQPHPQLKGERAIDVIAAGGGERVLAILDRLDGGAYL